MTLAVEIDAAMAQAWPPLVAHNIGGWTARFARGVTRRANSVLLLGTPPDTAVAVDEAERFYSARGLPATFLVSEASTPDLVIAELQQRGYCGVAETMVLHRPTATVGLDVGTTPAATDVVVSATVSELWFDSYWEADAHRRGAMQKSTMFNVLLRPLLPARFVTVIENGEPTAVGQVVVAGQVACIQSLATMPSARRRGAGRLATELLLAEAREVGADVAFAAVSVDNRASQQLFESLGFAHSHSYRYFVLAT